MEVPRLGVKSELQLPAYAIAHGNVGSLTHWARPGIKPSTSWFLVGFFSAAPWQELWSLLNLNKKPCKFPGCLSWTITLTDLLFSLPFSSLPFSLYFSHKQHPCCFSRAHAFSCLRAITLAPNSAQRCCSQKWKRHRPPLSSVSA